MSATAAAVRRFVGPDRRCVVAQLLLLAIVFAAAPVEFTRRGYRIGRLRRSSALIPALLAISIAGWAAISAWRSLAGHFTMSPSPVADGRLVRTGVYGMMRHPMYFAVVIGALGWAALWSSWAGMAGSAVMYAFFTLKVRHEERLLVRQYPEYGRYRGRVRGALFPRIGARVWRRD
jgi:protein-S-isoprenylcysteine O-methyltransferase Ste14